MRLSQFATAATVALSTQSQQSQAKTTAAFQPVRPFGVSRAPSTSRTTQISEPAKSLRLSSPKQPNVLAARDMRLGAGLPPGVEESLEQTLSQLQVGQTLYPLLDSIEFDALQLNREAGESLGLWLGTAGLLMCLEKAEQVENLAHEKPKSPSGTNFSQSLKQAHESLVLMSRKKLTKEVIKEELDVILEMLNRRLGGGNRGDDPDPESDPDKPQAELCSLPVYWKKLGLAYNQTSYGSERSPRIVVDTSYHPDLSSPGCPFENVKYVITHSDSSGQLNVAVVPKDHQLEDGNWYQALMRDEVLAEFVRHPDTCKPYLVFRTHVGKGDHGKGSSAEEFFERMRQWSSAPGWQAFVTNLSKSWLRARLQVFDTHRFHPVEGLLEVLDPSFAKNKEWEEAKIVWVNQSGDPDFNTVHDVGSVKQLLSELRKTSEQEKQLKHVENREKAWRDMIDGAKSSVKNLFKDVAMYWTRPENAALRQELEHTLMIILTVLKDLNDMGPGNP